MLITFNNFTSLKYKIKLLGNTLAQPAPSPANGIVTNATTTVTLKLPYHFSYISRLFETPLINCKFEFKLRSKSIVFHLCLLMKVIMLMSILIIFTIKDTKLYVLVVTLSAKDNQKLLKRLRKAFERFLYWNEYKTKSENENTTNEYKYILELNFFEVNRWFVLINPNQDGSGKTFDGKKYYSSKAIIKNYNVIANGKNRYDEPIEYDVNVNNRAR